MTLKEHMRLIAVSDRKPHYYSVRARKKRYAYANACGTCGSEGHEPDECPMGMQNKKEQKGSMITDLAKTFMTTTGDTLKGIYGPASNNTTNNTTNNQGSKLSTGVIVAIVIAVVVVIGFVAAIAIKKK